jgi:hypothetical protein
MAGQTRAENTESHFKVDFNYFELSPGDRSEPVRTFLWIVDTYLLVLRLFDEIFVEVIAHDRAAWDVRRNGVEAKLTLHKVKWKDVVLTR